MNLLGLEAIGTIVKTAGEVAGNFVTTDKERMAADLATYEAETARMQGQVDINKIEAASTSTFISGGRPAVLWICAFALAYASIIEPIARFIAKVCFSYVGEFPAVNTDLTLQVLVGALGLGVMRSYDKKNGVASK